MSKYTLDDEIISHGQFGIVEDNENLIRVLYEPEHIKNGMLLETAISLEDIKVRGFSLDRESYVKSTVIRNRIRNQKSKNPITRQRDTKSIFSCIGIRQIVDLNGVRVCVVLDTPSVTNPAHASLYSMKCSNSQLRKLRGLILPILQEGLTNFN